MLQVQHRYTQRKQLKNVNDRQRKTLILLILSISSVILRINVIPFFSLFVCIS